METNIREYAEEGPVTIVLKHPHPIKPPHLSPKRWCIIAKNECGYNCTIVDLLDVIVWVKENKPKLL
jgi:hypothetical protein